MEREPFTHQFEPIAGQKADNAEVPHCYKAVSRPRQKTPPTSGSAGLTPHWHRFDDPLRLFSSARISISSLCLFPFLIGRGLSSVKLCRM